MQESAPVSTPDTAAASQSETPSTVASTETTRIHHADKHSAGTYWTLHTVFLCIVAVAVVVILTARIKPNSVES